MARTHAKAEFTVPIKASRPRFELSTAFANVDVEKISSKANVEIEVGTFDGESCGRAESAVAKKGSSCVSRFRLARSDSDSCGRVVETSLSRHPKQAWRKGQSTQISPYELCGLSTKRGRYYGDDHNLRSNLHLGHCFVCCTTPFGDIVCGGGITVHTP
jgi:hypothetical protein